MSLWKLGLISAFALVFVIGTAPAFANDEADAEAAEEMEMEEEDVAVIEITEIIEDLNTDVISSQTSFGDVTADLDLTVSGGTDVSATAAAIANSLSIDSSTGVALEAEQIAEGAVVADALVSISNTSGDASATAAAMGNSLSATSEDSLSISSIFQDQGPGEFAEGAPEGIAASLSGSGDAGLADFSDIQGELGATAAALGNSATVNAGDIETGVTQITASGTDAFAGVEATGVDFDASVTAAAIGNSASLDSQSFGIVDLDQLNAGEADLAGVEAWMDNVQGSASATAAAIGNSANVASSDALDLMSTQESDADVASDFMGGMSGIAGDADVTAAAIGNSLSASAGDFDMLTDVLQANGGSQVTADVDSQLEWVGGDASATAAAISNSATFEVGTDLDLVIDQYSAADVNAGYTGCLLYTSPSPRDLSTSRMPSSA